MHRHGSTSLLPIALTAALGVGSLAGQNLLITEFMADNDSTLPDGYGHYPDWIEIHNPTWQAVDLGGWRLQNRQTSWWFPPRAITPGAYLVVFASGQAEPNQVDPAGNLHTNFQLDADGEPLALIDPAGKVVSEYAAPLPPQHPDVSYGLVAEQSVVLRGDTPARWWVPAGPVDTAWHTDTDFDDSDWPTGFAAAGFNLDPGPVLNNRGAIIAYRVRGGTPGSQAYGGALGMDFVVTEPLLVTELGVFDDGSNGLQTTLTAQLWRRDDRSTPTAFGDDRGAALLGALTFTPMNPGALEGASRFKPLPEALPLSPGSYTIVGYGYNASERNGNLGTGSGAEAQTTDGGGGAIQFVGLARYGDAGTFPRTVDGGPVDRYAAGTFKFVLGTDPELRTDVGAAMFDRSATLLLRIPFGVTNVTAWTSYALAVGYDDGFVAWLNGVEIARRNAPSSLDFAAEATAPGNALESIPLALPPGVMREGFNHLAIQGLNLHAANRDFIILPELAAARIERDAPRFFRHPTPGGPNAGSGVIGFAEEPRFSVGRGLYETPFAVGLSTATPGSAVRYTTDASTPSPTHGTPYTGAIPVNTTTVLRAIAYQDGLESSRVVTHTYLFPWDVAKQGNAPPGYPPSWGGVSADYGMVASASAYVRAAGNTSFTPEQARAAVAASLRSLPSLCLNTDIRHLFDATTGLYLNPSGRGEGWERPVSAELLLPDGTRGFEVNAGLQIMGFTSRSLTATPKLNFRLLFERQYGPGWLDYPFFGPGGAHRFNSIALRANSRDTWAAEYAGFGSALYLADQWAKEAQLDMGQPATRGRLVHLYLNGLYWGIYNPTERPDAAFISSYLSGERADYDVVKFCCPHLLEDGSMAAWNQLLAACRAGLGSQAAYQRVQGNHPDGSRNPAYPRLIDVDNFIDFALNGQFHASVDWPGNYYVGRHSNDALSEGFKFFQWDNDLAFSGGDLNANKVQTHPGNSWWTTSPGEMDIALRQNAEYRLRFADHVYRHFFHEGALTPAANIARWQRLAAILEPALYAESARWGDARAALRTVQDHWRPRSRAMVNTYFPARNAVVLGQLRNHGLYPRLATPEFEHHDGVVPPGFALQLTAPAAIYLTLDGPDPRLVGGAMHPAATRLAALGVLPIERTVTLRARAFDGTTWSALHEARFVAGRRPAPGDLIVSEMQYHPPPPSEAERAAGLSDPSVFEYLELVNTTGQTLDLRGLKFTSGVDFDWAEATDDTLAPGSCVLVVADREAFLMRHGPAFTNRIAGVFGGGTSLSNGGERLLLQQAGTNTLIDFVYGDAYPWPTAPDGEGASLVFDGILRPTDPASWRASLVPGGTPGERLSLQAEWLRLHFTVPERDDPRLSGDQADPDRDGQPNLLECASGSNPRHPDPDGGRLRVRTERVQSGPTPEGYLLLHFRRPVGGAPTVRVETSPDLIVWSPAEGLLTLTAVLRDPNGAWESVEFRTLTPIASMADSPTFWRLSLDATLREPPARL